LQFIETPGVPLSYRVEDKLRLAKDKERLAVNKSLTLAGIPREAFNYRLGNRSALDRVIDQYLVSTDKRSGITLRPEPGRRPGIHRPPGRPGDPHERGDRGDCECLAGLCGGDAVSHHLVAEDS